MAERVINMYSHNFYMDHYGVINPEEESTRAKLETKLKETVLPELNLRFMAMSEMELFYNSYICRANPYSDPPQFDGECTAETP